MLTSYIVVPFLTAAHGKLEPGNPQNLTDRNRAIRMAELLVLAAGVIVLEQEADAGKRLLRGARSSFCGAAAYRTSSSSRLAT